MLFIYVNINANVTKLTILTSLHKCYKILLDRMSLCQLYQLVVGLNAGEWQLSYLLQVQSNITITITLLPDGM